MSLNWDATEVAGIDTLTDNERVTLDALVWATIGIGMNEITEDNKVDFFKRLSFDEKVAGPKRYDFVDGERVPLYFTMDDVSRFVGLRTNASRWPITTFRTNVWKFHERWNVRL